MTVRPSAADRGRDLRPGGRAAGRRTTTAPARCSTGSASRCSPPPTTRATTSPRTPPWPPTRRSAAGCCRPSGPTATSSRPPGLGRRRRPARRASAASTPARYAGWVAAMEDRRAYFLAHGAVSADHSHVDVGTEPLAEPRTADLPRRRWPGGVAPAEAVALRRHMLLEMARMSCDDGLVMTLHPGVRRNHHGPTAARVRPGHRPRHPAAGRASPTRCGRCSSGSAPTRACTWCCSPSTRRCSPASWRRWPASTRRCTSGRPGGSSTPPTPIRRFRAAVTETAGFSRTVGLRRRHPRLLLDPGPARHVPPARRRLPGPAGRRAPAGRGRGDGDGRRPGRAAGRARCSSCERAAVAVGRRRPRSAPCTSGSAASSAPTRPGTPTAPATAWGIAAFSGRRPDLASALAAQDGLYTLVTRGPAEDDFDVDRARWPAPTPPRARRVAGLPGLAGRRRGHAHGHRGRLPAGRARPAGHRGPGGAGRPRRAARRRRRAGATAPARLLAGLLARRRADAGPSRSCPATTCPATAPRWPPCARRRGRRRPGAARLAGPARSPSSTTMVDRITPEPHRRRPRPRCWPAPASTTAARS